MKFEFSDIIFKGPLNNKMDADQNNWLLPQSSFRKLKQKSQKKLDPNLIIILDGN